MKRATILSVFCIVSFVLGLAVPSPFRLHSHRTADPDANPIQGVWTDVAWEKYGIASTFQHWGSGWGGTQSPLTYKIFDDRIEIGSNLRLFYLLDVDGVKGTIDWTYLNERGERIDETWERGCYAIKDDLLVIWMGEPAGPRQEKFEWSELSEYRLTILRRGMPKR